MSAASSSTPVSSSYGLDDISFANLQKEMETTKPDSYKAIALELLNVMATLFRNQCIDIDPHNDHKYDSAVRIIRIDENVLHFPGAHFQTLTLTTLKRGKERLTHKELLERKDPQHLKYLEEEKKKPVYFPKLFTHLNFPEGHQDTVEKFGRQIEDLSKHPKTIREGFVFTGPATVLGKFYLGSHNNLKMRITDINGHPAGEGKYDIKELTDRNQIKNIIDREYVIQEEHIPDPAPIHSRSSSRFCCCS